MYILNVPLLLYSKTNLTVLLSKIDFFINSSDA